MGDIQSTLFRGYYRLSYFYIVGTAMTLHFASEPDQVIEFGRLLQAARNRKGVSLEMMCKLLGMSQHQIQAIEEGDVRYFKKSTQSLVWHARLYAKKIGVEPPEFVFNGIRRHATIPSFFAQKIPAFLLKSTSPSTTDATDYGRR
jgi:transcriptional regulator with XRE-family HTH domain